MLIARNRAAFTFFKESVGSFRDIPTTASFCQLLSESGILFDREVKSFKSGPMARELLWWYVIIHSDPAQSRLRQWSFWCSACSFWRGCSAIVGTRARIFLFIPLCKTHILSTPQHSASETLPYTPPEVYVHYNLRPANSISTSYIYCFGFESTPGFRMARHGH